jgi:predicted phosphodiesterase
MRILVISDIHANLAAFEAVLEDAAGKWDVIWCLGDLIGYGPDPDECVTLLRQHEHLSLSGNHDWAVLGKLDIDIFNFEARTAIQWTQDNISTETFDYLNSLPSTHIHEPFTLAHASPRQPVWEYILDSYTATANLNHFSTPYCLVGHTHIPALFAEERKSSNIIPYAPMYSAPIRLNSLRCILNPGSVGQPRDSDPRAAYALLDTELMTWQYQRVPYPVDHTQDRMRESGIPERLVKRLELGW